MQRKKIGEYSIIPELESILNKNNIYLQDVFFLKSYLLECKCANLNKEFIVLFNKAVYLNEKIGILEYLILNDYDKDSIVEIINSELSYEYKDYSQDDIELYRYDLNELLRQLKRKRTY